MFINSEQAPRGAGGASAGIGWGLGMAIPEFCVMCHFPYIPR